MKIQTIGLILALPLQAAAQQPAPPPDFAKLAAAVAAYESGGPMESVRQIETLVRETRAKPALKRDIETALIAVLSGKSTFEGKRFACQYLAAIGTERSLSALAGLLRNNETVGIACLALGSYSSPKANDVLRNALPGLQGVARAQVIDTLGDRRDAASIKPLADLTHDPDALVAQAAITALSKIGNEPARRIIDSLRREKKPEFAAVLTSASFRIADQLAASGDRGGAMGIYDEFCHPSQPVHIRRAALAGILRLDKDGGERRILDVLRSQDADLKPVAIASVSSLKSPRASETFAAAMPRLQPELQVLMIGALASRGGDAARQAIAAQTQNANPNVALAAIQSLGALGESDSPKALEVVTTAMRNPDENIRDAAVRALANWPDPSATRLLLEHARAATNPTHQVLLLRGYIRLLGAPGQRTEEEKVRDYADALMLTRRPDERRLVIAGLADMTSPAALRLLGPMLDDPALQAEAAVAAVKMARASAAADRQQAEFFLQKVLSITKDPELQKEARGVLAQLR